VVLIIHGEDAGHNTELYRFRTLTANGSVASGFQATLSRNRTLTAHATLTGLVAAELDRIRTLSAIGRVNDDANKFGAATLSRIRTVEAHAKGKQNAKASLSRIRDVQAVGRVKLAASDKLRLLVVVSSDLAERPIQSQYASRVAATTAELAPALYPIKGFTYSERKGEAGVTLELQLVRPSDRGAILAADSFAFQIFDGTDWIEMFSSGQRSGVGFSFTFDAGAPKDVLSLTTNGDIDKKLILTPQNNTTIYDPTRATISATEFKTLKDTFGRSYPQTLIPTAGLDLYTLLDFVLVHTLGFDSFETTCPNFPIRRADFSILGSWYDGLLAHLAAFKPLVFVRPNGGNGVIWLVDSTAKFPRGFGDPFTLAGRDFQDPSFQVDELGIDAYQVTFADVEVDYDFQTNRFETDDPDIIGTLGSPGYMEIHKRRTFVDFFKNDQPTVPIRSEKIQEVEETLAYVGGALLTISTETEDVEYDSFGRLQFISKEHRGIVPDLTLAEYPAIEKLIRRERTRFDYYPDRFTQTRTNLSKTTKEVDGLVTIDTTNLHLGQPFVQEFSEAHAAGNLSQGLTVAFTKISNFTEQTIQNEKGQFETRTRTVNFLTNPPQVINSTTDARQGDMSLNTQTGSTSDILVFRVGSTRTNLRVVQLNVAECPIGIAVELAERLLSKTANETGTLPLVGLRLSLMKGCMIKLEDRDGIEIGKYQVEGFTIQASELGTARQRTRQTLELHKL
jgi:hypothetical protein